MVPFAIPAQETVSRLDWTLAAGGDANTPGPDLVLIVPCR
jgi:hypothetical protein